MKKLIINILIFFFLMNCYPESQKTKSDAVNYENLNKLLSGYLENDLNLRKNVITADSKRLSLKSVKAENGISVALASGDVKVQTDLENRTKVSFTPTATVKIPYVSDGQVDAKFPVTINGGEKTIDGASVSATVGIVSGSGKQRKIKILEADRAVKEAERNVNNSTLSAEKDFYTNLKKLYNYAVTVLQKRSDLYDDIIDLKVLETQGYSKNSSAYRIKFLKVESDRRDVTEKQRLFQHETAIFAKKCGIAFERTESDEENFNRCLEFLPTEIPVVEWEDILKFPENLYSETERAEWEKYINELKRKADYAMTLKATAGFNFNDSFSHQDTVGGKLVLAYDGITASAGAYVPTDSKVFDSSSTAEKNDNPYFMFSIAFDLVQFRSAKIKRQQDKLNSDLEEIAIKSARNNYETACIEKISSLADIKWSENSYEEEFDMYSKLEKDMERWLKQGIVTENDYLDAKVNREKARINILLNKVEQIIYNNETKLLFVEK